MMMPANYSAVAENELTYVNGGADLSAYLAPAMTAGNWATLNTNLINLVGNSYLNAFLFDSLSNVFSGFYTVGANAEQAFRGLSNMWDTNMEIGENKGWGLLRAMTNVGLQIVGGLSAIYTLGDSKIGLKLSKDGSLNEGKSFF